MQNPAKMRLTCPNCGAQYEVPADVMPPEGRDVQCSACGHGWYQYHPEFPEGDMPDTEDTPAIEDKAPAAPAAETSPSGTQAARSGGTRPDEPQEMAPPPRRELDPAVASVLRAEAELETRARRKEAGAVETQPDLGLPEAGRPPRDVPLPAPGKIAQFPGPRKAAGPETSAFPAGAAAADQAPRRDLLPDIEELKSTLRSNHDRSPTIDPGQTARAEAQDARGARLGFTLTLAVAAVLAAAYVFSPQLAEAIPEIAPTVERYVLLVDAARLWLSTQLAAATEWIGVQAAAVLAWVESLAQGSTP